MKNYLSKEFFDLTKQLIRKMKTTCLLLLVFASSLFATNVNSQVLKVSMNMKNTSITEVISSIEKQTDYLFVYDKNKVDLSRKVDVDATNQSVAEVLTNVFSKTDVVYAMEGNNIMLMPKSDSVLLDQQQQKSVSGKVTDSSGISLPGVSIVVKGTITGTITDSDGNYLLTKIPENTILQFSFVGMKMQEIEVGDKSIINVSLVDEAIGLEEVVAIGYGTQRKGNLTGSVANVKSEKLSVAPVTSTTNTLVGQLPGLTAIQTSGMPGSDAAELKIRGFGSALIIVDGVEGSLNNLDPSQIESVSILKDGAASIYGARAGNGVILVTTKRGENQKPTISINSSYTLQGVTKILHPANSGQTAEMERESYLQAGGVEGSAPWTQEAIDKFYAGNDPGYINTDWYDYTFRDWAPQQNHNLSLRGGSDKIRYFGYFGYSNQETMVKRNGGKYSRYNLQSNVDADISKNLKMSVDISMSVQDQNFPIRGMNNEGAFWQDYYRTRPWYPATLPDPTKVAWGGIDVGSIATVSNIDLMGYSRNQNKNTKGVATLTYDFEKIKGLKAKATVNYSTTDVYAKSFNKPILFWTYNTTTEEYTNAGSFTQSRLTERMNRGHVLTQQYSLNYSNEFSDIHRVSALVLYESMELKSNYFNATRTDLLTSAIDQLFMGSATGMGNDGSASEMGRRSYVGRFNYSLKDRYLLETIIRADASAKFPSDSRWGYFPSVSAGWIISEEKFMDKFSAIDNLKIRASFGQSGNDAVGNFQYLSGYSTRGSVIFDEGQSTGIYITGLANPNLTWEKMSIYNGGLDFMLYNKKIYGTFDAFYRERTGIPATRATSLPSTFGSSLPPENLNSLSDRGFEFMMGTSGHFGNLSYDFSGNLSWSRSKWIHYEEPEYTDPDQERIYKKSGVWTDRAMGYVSDGLFTSQDEINAIDYTYSALGGNSTLKPGDVKYLDTNNDKILDWKDQVEIGKGTFPHWMYGINTNIKYKNFSFSGLFQGAFGFNTYVDITTYPNEVMYDLRWTEKNNDANALVSRLGGASTNYLYSDYRLIPVSYIRLKTASLGYDLPEQFLNKFGLSKLRIYFAGTNLFTLSTLDKYRIDPETESGQIKVYPQQRTISLGFNLSF